MVSRACDQCGANVATDEQFCPSCGSFIDPLSTTPAPTPRPAPVITARPGNVISVSSDGPYEEFSLDQPPVEAAPPPPGNSRGGDGGSVECPSCGTRNPSTNLHCQNCGARLRQGPLPTAPRPAVQVTAGVRAALAISGLLLIVILVALAFNIFGGDETASSTTTESTSTTSTQPLENTPIQILSVTCEPIGLGSYSCSNLTDGTNSEFQVNWEDLEADESPLKIRLNFSQAMTVQRIEWVNIADETRFRQNHRARGISLDAPDHISFSHNLDDTPGTQDFRYAALDADYIDITVHSTYRSQVEDNQSFPELAIAEIVVWGRPHISTSG